jgi:hypothetical protein
MSVRFRPCANSIAGLVKRPEVMTVDGLRMAYVFYESGLSINVMYGLADGAKRAVGFKLSEGMEIPEELASRFKFARQKSKLAGVIRGSFFVIKGEY